jgi:Zn-dependent membrane protease YugP
MAKSLGKRRVGAMIMVLLGIILMIFAPEIWLGALVFSLGVVLELVSISLEHKTK